MLLEGVGLVAVGKTRAEASVAADVYEHGIDVMSAAADIGDVRAGVARRPVRRGVLEPRAGEDQEDAAGGARGADRARDGGGSGIGRATARRLAELGAHVVMVDRDARTLGEAQAEIGRGRGSQVTSFEGDVTSRADVEGAVALAVRTFGGLDLVVSNAGDGARGAAVDRRRGRGAARRRSS